MKIDFRVNRKVRQGFVVLQRFEAKQCCSSILLTDGDLENVTTSLKPTNKQNPGVPKWFEKMLFKPIFKPKSWL